MGEGAVVEADVRFVARNGYGPVAKGCPLSKTTARFGIGDYNDQTVSTTAAASTTWSAADPSGLPARSTAGSGPAVPEPVSFARAARCSA